MIATSAFSTGNHYPHVYLVLHINKPFKMLEYVQGQGRAGHDGSPALCSSQAIIPKTYIQMTVMPGRGVVQADEHNTFIRLMPTTFIEANMQAKELKSKRELIILEEVKQLQSALEDHMLKVTFAPLFEGTISITPRALTAMVLGSKWHSEGRRQVLTFQMTWRGLKASDFAWNDLMRAGNKHFALEMIWGGVKSKCLHLKQHGGGEGKRVCPRWHRGRWKAWNEWLGLQKQWDLWWKCGFGCMWMGNMFGCCVGGHVHCSCLMWWCSMGYH